jgi:hypothetical protein
MKGCLKFYNFNRPKLVSVFGGKSDQNIMTGNMKGDKFYNFNKLGLVGL